MSDALLATRIGKLELSSPLLTGSGTFGHDGGALQFIRSGDLGGLVLKTVTPRPRPGNAMPRLTETPSGLLNSIGLENRGVDAFLRDNLEALGRVRVPVIANAGGESVEEFLTMVEAFDRHPVFQAIEINLSCPNVQGGRLHFSTSATAIEEVVEACRAKTDKPLWAKLSPNVTRIAPLAEAAGKAGADGLTVCNTLLGLAVDWRRRKPVLGAGFGGLSGPAVRPVALRLVHEVAQAVDLPIIASGGIACADDVLQFLVTGASAVQLGTAAFRRPDLASVIARDLRRYLGEEKTSVIDIQRTLQWPAPATRSATEDFRQSGPRSLR